MAVSSDKWKEWYQTHEEEVRQDFFTFLKFPSISTDPEYHEATCKTAEWLAAYLRQIGMDVEVWKTSGKPVVFATHLTAEASSPTLLIYHHYDVQPVDPLELWESPPFEPRLKEGVVYARGASDNKGQCFYTITALKAFLELAKSVRVNIKLFIEGEEESGGPGTYEVLKSKKEALKADHLLIVDTGLRARDLPSVTVGVRGIMAMEVECQNSEGDLHSGTHGGIALNPNRVLASALAGLWNSQGRVAVPGFYDRVIPVSETELARLDMEFDLEAYQSGFGVSAFGAEEGVSLAASNLLHPTLEINGMSGGYAGFGFKTVIPAKAIGKISCRLVPAQDPDEVYEQVVAFLRAQMPLGIKFSAKYHHGAPAFRTPIDASIVQIAKSAYEEVMGTKCSCVLNGASIPIVGALKEASSAEVALIGMALDTDDIHAPNEHFAMERFEKGVLLMLNILERHRQC